MPSANFTVNGSSVPPELAVSANSLVSLALVSATGVRTVAWSIVGNHSSSAINPTITPGGSPLGSTASFTMPSGSNQAYLIQCVINNGTDDEGQVVSTYTKRAIVGVANSNGRVPFCVGESDERSATHGYTEALNEISDESGGGGGGGVTDHGALTGLSDDDHSQYDLAALPIVSLTGSSNVLALTHLRKFLRVSHSGATALTVPPNSSVAFPTGSLIRGVQIGTGTVTLTPGSGVTLNGTAVVPAQWGWFELRKVATDTWDVDVGSAPGGTGDVVGPASATNDRIAVYDGTTGKLLKDGGQTIAEVIASAGTGLTPGSATGQTLRWDGDSYEPGPLDLANSDARTGTLPVANGGTGLSTLGTGLQVLRTNAGATAAEWATISNGHTITSQGGSALTTRTTLNFAAPFTASDNSGSSRTDVDLTLDGSTLSKSSSGLKVADGGLTNTQLSGSAGIAKSKFESSGACSVVGRSANSSGGVADISATTNGVVFCRRSNAVTAALLLDENIDSAAAIAGSKISPDFGSQTVSTTGTINHGATPRATTGNYRTGSVWQHCARNLADTADANVCSYGVVANDTMAFGDTFLGLQWEEIAAGRTVLGMLGGQATTTTQMPANTGNRIGFMWNTGEPPTTGRPSTDGLAFWAQSSALKTMAPTSVAAWALSVDAPFGRDFAYGQLQTNSTGANQVIASISTAAFGDDCSGSVTIDIATGTATQANQGHHGVVTWYRQDGTLTVGTYQNVGANTNDGTISTAANGDLIEIRVTPASATNRRWRALCEYRWAVALYS